MYSCRTKRHKLKKTKSVIISSKYEQKRTSPPITKPKPASTSAQKVFAPTEIDANTYISFLSRHQSKEVAHKISAHVCH